MLYSLNMSQFIGTSYIIQCDMLVEMMLVRLPLNENYASLIRRVSRFGAIYCVLLCFWLFAPFLNCINVLYPEKEVTRNLQYKWVPNRFNNSQ